MRPAPGDDRTENIGSRVAAGYPKRLLAWALAGSSGLLLLAAFPGTGDQAWLAFVALVPLLLSLDGSGPTRAAGLGFTAGLIFWLVTIAWPAPAVLRFGGVALHRGALTIAVVVIVLALYTALFSAVLAAVSRQPPASWVAFAACSWVAVELLRTYLFSGFPWNLLAYSQYRTLPLIQIATLTGVYGVSFVVMAVNAAVARVWQGIVGGQGGVRAALYAAGVGGGSVGLALLAGSVMPTAHDAGNPVRVAVAQGNIDQGVKWDSAYRDFTLEVYAELTRDAAQHDVKLIVWPETAVPLLRRDDGHWARVTELARSAHAYLVVGAPDRVAGAARNGVFLLAPDGTVLDRYDKRHLLPFGEYLPESLGLLRVVGGGVVSGFTPGTRVVVFSTPFGGLAPMVCFEVIFPGEVRERVAAGADVIINVTNDAWFGRSPIARQHLAAAVFRAVENRAWMVRAANTGISAIVAPDGRIVRASGLFTREVLIGSYARRRTTTPYTRYGDIMAWASAGVTVAFLPRIGRRRQRVPEAAAEH